MNLSFGDRPVCCAGPADQRSVGGDQPFAAPDGLFVKRRRGQIPEDARGGDTLGVQRAQRLDGRGHAALLSDAASATYAELGDRTRRFSLRQPDGERLWGKL